MKLVSLRAALCLAALCSTAACATVTRGSNDTFTVQTSPNGAAVRTSNGFACDQTPCSFKMSRKSEFGVDITKPGYKSWHGQVTNKVSGAGGVGMAGNVLVGGIIGAGVDVVTGAMLDLTPNPLVVILEALAGGAATSTAAQP
jgi:hypothetical protein